MYTSIRRYNVSPGSTNEVIKRAVEGFVPIISKAPGFLAYDVLNTGNDSVTTISTFDTQLGAEKSNNTAAEWVQENLAPFITEPPLILGGKVSVHKAR